MPINRLPLADAYLKAGYDQEKAIAVANVTGEAIDQATAGLVTKEYFDSKLTAELAALSSRLATWVISAFTLMTMFIGAIKYFE